MFLHVPIDTWDAILDLIPVSGGIESAGGRSGKGPPSILALACVSRGFHNVVVKHLGNLAEANLGRTWRGRGGECGTLTTTGATIWRFLRQTPSLLSLSLADLRFVDDIILEGIATLCPYLERLDLRNCAARGRNRNCSISAHGVEQGLCRLRHLTSTFMCALPCQ